MPYPLQYSPVEPYSTSAGIHATKLHMLLLECHRNYGYHKQLLYGLRKGAKLNSSDE
jgi:hypothetical protein